MEQKIKIIALAGPSATGKSDLAVKLAEKFCGEIISADSRYIYKEINIATAKPTDEEKKNIPHYLIDICDVTDEYSVGRFVKDADNCIRDINKRGKLPIVTGGTGLYFRSLRGTFDIPEVMPDYEFRTKAENLSNEELYKELSALNPELTEKIHINNKRKIIRALEISKANVVPESKDCPYDILWLCLNAKDRQYLYDRANLRVDKMFEAGLLKEAEFLFGKYGQNGILMNTIGIKELYDVLYNNGDLAYAAEEIKKNTRHYIKRQISWFKTEKDMNYLNIDEEDIFEKSQTLVSDFL
ncbi:MAG: tRNA (adenosine(37)-N6)-dimethylallyltransferase MiaA [Candidatus Gastranaerophilales bacterium]|nr:tRNA (adenosine(37)-N6)-dimethylallyltransferase MiaA [Candidatus Gastranaerophilales bacterium]